MVPMTSEGIRSGVNCSRLKPRSSDAASALTSRVLATPGTPSSNTWPRTSRVATSPETTASWPTTTFATSSRTASTAWRGEAWDGPVTAASAGMDDLLSDGLDGLGQRDQRRLRIGRRAGKRAETCVAVEPGRGRRGIGYDLRRDVARQ